jgi:hypothetical protein
VVGYRNESRFANRGAGNRMTGHLDLKKREKRRVKGR